MKSSHMKFIFINLNLLKLNPIFSYQPGVLRKKYGIDIKVLMDKYPIPEKNMGGKVR